MQQSSLGPDAAEYARRLARVQEGMAERSFAALLVTDPANMYYLTGYNAWSFYTPQCLVVPADGQPVLFARAMDAAGAGFTAWLPPEQIEGYPEELVHRPKVHPYDWIAERVRERGLIETGPDGCVGIEGDSAFFTARGYLALRAGLPHVRLEDSQELVNWVRVVKSDHELAQMRIAGSIAQQVMEVALAAVAPGRRQCDVVAEIAAAQARGTAEHGGDYPALVPMLPTGEGAGTPHLTWTEEKFRVGEATTIELAGVYRRYHAPLARTIMLGEPPRLLADTAAIVRDGMAEVLATLRPGRTAHEIHAAWNAVISAHGLTKESRIGYSIGLGYPPDWGERTISLRPDEHTVLEAGMCFHVILGMWMDDWGYELSEPVALTTDGVERLTDLTQNLTIGR
ncbi:M24 family metallopeptidase [Nonomuraea sp. NEAU-A123]|uniref:M24 family metallopeptidase n=1 Tax=Nonomuraea sp. NEAU-A123 TaxID=2839649 RepID=UPI001BE439EE|nr:M24 family metallopeptidase [Nonomuraea sp. NEAU-A123]MBT2231478.1 M24 family metallopeptidase [Nonomuraea sp. NEAU-A123]